MKKTLIVGLSSVIFVGALLWVATLLESLTAEEAWPIFWQITAIIGVVVLASLAITGLSKVK